MSEIVPVRIDWGHHKAGSKDGAGDSLHHLKACCGCGLQMDDRLLVVMGLRLVGDYLFVRLLMLIVCIWRDIEKIFFDAVIFLLP